MYHQPEWLKKITRLPEINMNMRFFGGHQQRVPFGWVAERETHFAFEIMTILDGVQCTDFFSRQYAFRAGDIILIPPGTSHENSCISKEGMRYFCVHFDIDEPGIQQALLMYCPVQLRKDNAVFPRIKEILDTYVALLDQEHFSLREKLLVEKLLIDLILSLFDYATYEQEKIAASDNSSIVLAKSIADTIQKNFHTFVEQPSDEKRALLHMKTVAESMSISESTMLKTFKRIYGISPKQYLDQLRYNESKFLLHQPKISIGEIAEIIGYQSLSHFSRQFKRWSNVSPNEYREMNKPNS